MANLEIAQTDWVIYNQTLTKRYKYQGLLGEGSEHIIQLEIDVTPNSILGGINKHFCLFVSPSFWELDLGFFAAQLAPAGASREVPFVNVRVGRADDGSLLIQPIDREGTETFLDTLGTGKKMRFLIVGQEGVLVELPIPNDAQYLEAAQLFFSRMVEKLDFVPNDPSDIFRNNGAISRGATLARYMQRMFS